MSPGPSFTAPESQAQSVLKTQCSSDTKWVQGRTQVATCSRAFMPQSSGSSPQDATWAAQQRQAQKGKSTRGVHTAAAGRGAGAARPSGTGARPCGQGEAGARGGKGGRGLEGMTDARVPSWEAGRGQRGPRMFSTGGLGVSGRRAQRPHHRQQHGPLMPGARGDGLGGPRTGSGPLTAASLLSAHC